MKRFRLTLIAVCLLLGWLGFTDLSLLLHNPEPLPISLNELKNQGPPREWLHIEGGQQQLLEAINMSGTMEIDAFLVPLKETAGQQPARVWFETRNPEIVAALKRYYFILETEQQRQEFLQNNRELFSARRPVTGMTVGSLIAGANRDKLHKLLRQVGVPVSEQTIFISEGKQPPVWRGIFFSLSALLGLGMVLRDRLRSTTGRI